MISNQKFTLNQMQQIFAASGCELLEDQYINSQSKMRYRCSCGNESSINYSNFRLGKRCGCGRVGANRYSEEEIRKIVGDRGCTYLSSTYDDENHRLSYICKCGNAKQITLKGFQKSNRCHDCYGKTMSLSFESVRNYFESKGCLLLETEYKNVKTKMRYRCSCGTESSITFDSFKRGNRCRQCGNAKSKTRQSLSHDFVKSYFAKQDCELLEDYTHSRNPMAYRCSCGNISTISWNNFQRGRRCRLCGICRRSGNNHYEWIEDRDEYKKFCDLKQRCYKALRASLKASSKSKSDKTSVMMGYSVQDLKTRIESHPNWSTIKDQGWHLDHIYPIKAFKEYGIDDIRLINALDNLQPLEGRENIIKSDHYDRQNFETWLRSKAISFKGPTL